MSRRPTVVLILLAAVACQKQPAPDRASVGTAAPAAIPPAAEKTLNVTVTLTVSETKQMTVKTTVAETASTQMFGPFTVD